MKLKSVYNIYNFIQKKLDIRQKTKKEKNLKFSEY